MKEINFQHYIKEKKLEIIWGEGEKKEIHINKDEDVDLNNLYDFIINNINQVNLKFNCENDEHDVASKASRIIFKKIELELEEIKKVENGFRFDKEAINN